MRMTLKDAVRPGLLAFALGALGACATVTEDALWPEAAPDWLTDRMAFPTGSATGDVADTAGEAGNAPPVSVLQANDAPSVAGRRDRREVTDRSAEVQVDQLAEPRSDSSLYLEPVEGRDRGMSRSMLNFSE